MKLLNLKKNKILFQDELLFFVTHKCPVRSFLNLFFFYIFYCICAIQECIEFETSFKLHKILILSR